MSGAVLPSNAPFPGGLVRYGNRNVITVREARIDVVTFQLPAVMYGPPMVSQVPRGKNRLGLVLSDVHDVVVEATIHVRQHGLPGLADLSLSIPIDCVISAGEGHLVHLTDNVELL